MHSSRFTPGHNTTDTKKGLTMNTTNTISNSPNTSGTNSSAVGAGNANTSPAGADTASNHDWSHQQQCSGHPEHGRNHQRGR